MAVEVCGAHGWPRNRRWLGMVGECWAEGVVMNGGGGVWSAWVAAQPALVGHGGGVLGGGCGDEWRWRCVERMGGRATGVGWAWWGSAGRRVW